MNPTTIAVFLIFSLPIVAVLSWVYVKRLDHLGGADQDLQLRFQRVIDALTDRVDALETERDALQQRVINLETIVTSEAWDETHGPATSSPRSTDSSTAEASAAEASTKNGTAPDRISLEETADDPTAESASERAARIARNLRRT